MKKLVSCLLCLALLMTAVPASAVSTLMEERQPYIIDNGYIRAEVSKENGGFAINAEEGDLLKKSDNNKKLLFHNGKYDTSFVSFRVDFGSGNVEDYIFGGKYGGIDDSSRKGVTVSQAKENGEIIASWSVGELTFIQSISLPNEDDTEHGMVSIQLAVKNDSGSPVNVKARILLDTCLGDKDFAYYQVVRENFASETVTAERILDGTSYTIPQNFYAMSDAYNPEIIAYSVNSPTSMPYQIAFGHWNNLASTLFDFAPDGTFDFTNPYNEYKTADSAYALYYDLGNVTSAEPVGMLSYYGVYSNRAVPAANSVSVNATAPIRLDLNSTKTDYTPLSNVVGIADFSAAVTFENYASETAKHLDSIVLSVQTTGNIRPLGDTGQEAEGYGFDSPKSFNIPYTDVEIGKPISKTLYFDARLSDKAVYERIAIGIYDVSATGGEIAADHKLGEKIVYILLPGSDGGIPEVTFASMTPEIIYNSGTRHLFVSVTNQTMLDNRGNWNLRAYTVDGKNRVDIPHDLITINEGVMDVALTNDIKMAEGSWFLQLEWTDAAVTSKLVPAEHQRQTAPALNFVVSKETKYKNDSYGVLCVVEYEINHKSAYRLESFKDENAFKDFQKQTSKYVEILLTFRGEFIAEKHVKDSEDHKEYTYYTAVSKKMLDINTREYTVDNCISVNDCMDFEGGTMAVYYDDYKTPDGYKTASIKVEFDGELLTSDARTSVWKGKAILTEIVQGEEFSLRPYDENGERKDNFDDNTIKLIWPSIYGAGQTLAGMIFKMAYGELGVMVDDKDKELGRVLSFSASLSLSFLSPKEGAEPENTYWSKMQDIFKYYTNDKSLYSYNLAQYQNMFDFSNVNEDTDDEKKGVTGSVMVQDVLFGCGQGFVGVHFNVNIGMQNYIDNMPGLTGMLEVNTINDWAFKFEGGMKLATFALEAKLSFKSHNDIPVPDEIYFYMGGFKPGVNIDGFGVVWITGGGGGISNLYDTIFLTQSVPPLKLILTVSFSIVQVLDGKATLSLGLTGISLSAEELKIFGTIEAIKKVYLGLEWYPGIDLKASISINLFNGVIKGGGYIVLIGKEYTDWFFEMYAHAALFIPESVPLVGGMELLAVDLGLNNEKIWGGFKVIGIGYGVVYYWGEGEVDFPKGGQMAKPTYPDLLGQEDIPIHYDEERDQTLYARFGTNISAPVEAELVDLSQTPQLMDASLKTRDDLKLHKFNLGTYNASNDVIVQIDYSADDLADAKKKAESFKINDAQTFDGTPFPIVLYNEEFAADASENANANANITFNSTTGRASYCFTVTKSNHYNKDWWYISTGDIESNVLLYNVGTLPSVDTVSGTKSVTDIDLSWTGASLDELDRISFYLSEKGPNDITTPENIDPANPTSEQTDGGRLLKIIEDSSLISSKNVSVAIPADLPSGDYYIRAVYSKEDLVNGVVFSTGKITLENSYTPENCTIRGFVSDGNLEYKLTIDETADVKTDGYQVTIYNADDDTPTDIAELTFERAEGGNTTFNIGGRYEYDGKVIGLTGGESYYAGVTPYNLIDTDTDPAAEGYGKDDTIVYGQEVFTSNVLLPVQTTPQVVSIVAEPTAKPVERIEWRDHDNNPETDPIEVSVVYDTFTDNSVTFTATISDDVSGQWWLDDALTVEIGARTPDEYKNQLANLKGNFKSTNQITIPLTELTEGSHTLSITGRDAGGDRFQYNYAFDIDTTPPRLMLGSPVNGSLFGTDGKLTISGVTDADARFTITSDGAQVCSDKKVTDFADGEIDPAGVFKFTVDIPDPNSDSQRDLVISTTDAVGNLVTENIRVTHGGLADLKELQVLVDGNVLSSGNISTSLPGEQCRQLSLAGVTTGGARFMITNNSNVDWLCQTVEGSANVDDNGLLTTGAASQGMLIAQLEVGNRVVEENGVQETRGAYYRTAALSFGADISKGTVEVTSGIGGKATGGGVYMPGDTVTLKATPDSGYSFSGWTIVGATVANTGASTVTFVMPESGNVTAHAAFSPVPRESGGSTVITSINASTGAPVKLKVPAGANLNTFVAYYLNADGSRSYVGLSSVINGNLCFNAPVAGRYYFVDNSVAFDDTQGHWAEQAIGFMAARGLFQGVAEDLFAPNEPMTRAMFVTVLYRLAGSPELEKLAAFQDIPANTWYEKAVAWASESGIVMGMSPSTFAPNKLITREQMCALIARYARFVGISLPGELEALAFKDGDTISGWAVGDVAFCQTRGLVGGYPDKSFMPMANATRAENCTVFMRFIEALMKQMMK